MRQHVPSAIQVLGLGCISAAAYLVALPLGLLASGVSLIVIGFGLDILSGSPRK